MIAATLYAGRTRTLVAVVFSVAGEAAGFCTGEAPAAGVGEADEATADGSAEDPEFGGGVKAVVAASGEASNSPATIMSR